MTDWTSAVYTENEIELSYRCGLVENESELSWLIRLGKHTFLGSLKGTLYLNPKKYHDASIENTYCYQFPSTMTQSIGNRWSAYDLTRRSKSLLTLAQAQYSLKVER